MLKWTKMYASTIVNKIYCYIILFLLLDEFLFIEEMQMYLKERNQSIENNVDTHEVQEIYEIYKELEWRSNNINTMVPFQK